MILHTFYIHHNIHTESGSGFGSGFFPKIQIQSDFDSESKNAVELGSDPLRAYLWSLGENICSLHQPALKNKVTIHWKKLFYREKKSIALYLSVHTLCGRFTTLAVLMGKTRNGIRIRVGVWRFLLNSEWSQSAFFVKFLENQKWHYSVTVNCDFDVTTLVF